MVLISNYEIALSEYEACLEYNKILCDKLSILKGAYDSGNISELDYLESYVNIKTEINKADNALVNNVDFLLDELKLVEDGVLRE